MLSASVVNIHVDEGGRFSHGSRSERRGHDRSGMRCTSGSMNGGTSVEPMTFGECKEFF